MNNNNNQSARNEIIFNRGSSKTPGGELGEDIDLEIILLGPKQKVQTRTNGHLARRHRQKTRLKTADSNNPSIDSLDLQKSESDSQTKDLIRPTSTNDDNDSSSKISESPLPELEEESDDTERPAADGQESDRDKAQDSPVDAQSKQENNRPLTDYILDRMERRFRGKGSDNPRKEGGRHIDYMDYF